MSFVVHLQPRKLIDTHEDCQVFEDVCRGCKSLAIVDLKGDDAQKAADELKSYAVGSLNVFPTVLYTSILIVHVASQFSEAGDLNFIGVECDVSSESSVKKTYGTVVDIFGKLDAVVASAGVWKESFSR